jgi:hypothetical protein
MEELNQRFTNQSPELSETHADLIWRGGQRSVIEFLQKIFEEQSSSQLGE